LVSFGNTSHPFTGGDFQKRKIWIIFTHRKNQLILQHKLPGTRKPEEPKKNVDFMAIGYGLESLKFSSHVFNKARTQNCIYQNAHGNHWPEEDI
jgi:hypothetical protein